MSDQHEKSAKSTVNGAGSGGFRQAHAWLHTWCGLWFSWLLFAVFLTGTLAVFEDPITHWMTPEHHAEEAAEHSKPQPVASLSQRLAWGVDYMREHHLTASMWELWPADAQGAGELRVFWFDANKQYAAAQLSTADGKPIEVSKAPPVRGTQGGHHFVTFHYELHAGTVGLWIVGIAALAMLVALVSGVITHRRIFKDFFTFRPRKGQRSWLDAHNVVAVLTLPFQFMIAYTGLAISALTFMPAGVVAHYGVQNADRERFSTELNEPGKPAVSGQFMAVPELESFVLRGQQLMGQPVRAVVIDHPGDASARIGVYGWNDEESTLRRIGPNSGMAMFSAATGEVLQVRQPGGADGGTATLAQSVMGGLHMVRFGGWALQWLYFICGLMGAVMMATGAILFMVKRRHKHLGEFGSATVRVYRLIEGLNVAAIAGLTLACVGYLWGNRLVPLGIAHRGDWELGVFFALWALSLVHALCRPPRSAWKEQLAALALLCLLLPVLNAITTGAFLFSQMLHGDWESAGVEMVVVATGLLALAALRWQSGLAVSRAPATNRVPTEVNP
ncbi:PepSY domain-containing protein [Diaphorobacter sp. HDW4A]|uniref:PepSY-associated TM helix domain-containing protein n=1 Tax=Diaphorobacter sp. HDW4A TaxID=2714924 RepID=UPI00140CDD06|nr:PepSY-associated TM helix domain-containing protein [Diaphorobacter sp. HDW4A]QIL80213.1 PepSY domain-containing protein [Diaphorobacter sp. HDW4A]